MSNGLLMVWTVISVLVLTGCAGVPADRGAESVATMALERGGHVVDLGAEAVERPRPQGETLTRADAVRLALTHNPELRGLYAELGIGAADVVQAARLSNPRISASIMTSSASGTANQLTFGIAQNFADLLLLPSRHRLAEGQFQRTRVEVAGAILDLAARTEIAWHRLAAASQTLRMRELQETAAGLSAELAGRFREAGNISERALALEEAEASEARLARLRAEVLVQEAKSDLNRLMGLSPGETGWIMKDGLALPVAEEDDLNDLLVQALEQRPDLISARMEVKLLAEGAELARKFRYLGAAEIGVEYERETDRSRLFGPFLTLALPMFDQNQGAVLRADARLESGLARLEALEIETGNAVYLTHQRLLAAREAALEYQDVLIPRRTAIVEWTQERVNFMLDDVFELIRVKRREYDAYPGYIEILRDYWISRVELTRLTGTELPSARAAEDAKPLRLPEKAEEVAREHEYAHPDPVEPDHDHYHDHHHVPEPMPHHHHHH